MIHSCRIKINHFSIIGHEIKNGSWIGLLGDVINGHSDIALELIQSNDYSNRLSYAFPLFHSM